MDAIVTATISFARGACCGGVRAWLLLRKDSISLIGQNPVRRAHRGGIHRGLELLGYSCPVHHTLRNGSATQIPKRIRRSSSLAMAMAMAMAKQR
jgi:hypothetical protein